MKVLIAAVVFFLIGFWLGDVTPRQFPTLNAVVDATEPATPTPESVSTAPEHASVLTTILKEVAAVPPIEGSLAVASGSANRLCRPDDTAVIAGSIAPNDLLLVVGKDASGDYRRLSDGTWVTNIMVDPIFVEAPIMDELSPIDVDWTNIRLLTTMQLEKAPKDEEEKAKVEEAQKEIAKEEPSKAAATDTPTPWPRPTGEVSTTTLAYANELLTAAGVLQEGALEQALRQGGLQNLLLDWVTTMRRHLTLVHEQYIRIRQTEPPAELNDVYDQFIAAAQQCEESANLLTEGLENNNLSALQQGLRTYQACRLGLAETAQTIRTYANHWAVSDLSPSPTPTLMPQPTETPAP